MLKMPASCREGLQAPTASLTQAHSHVHSPTQSPWWNVSKLSTGWQETGLAPQGEPPDPPREDKLC